MNIHLAYAAPKGSITAASAQPSQHPKAMPRVRELRSEPSHRNVQQSKVGGGRPSAAAFRREGGAHQPPFVPWETGKEQIMRARWCRGCVAAKAV